MNIRNKPESRQRPVLAAVVHCAVFDS